MHLPMIVIYWRFYVTKQISHKYVNSYLTIFSGSVFSQVTLSALGCSIP